MTVAGMLRKTRAILVWVALNFAAAAALLCLVFAGRVGPELNPDGADRAAAPGSSAPAEYVLAIHPGRPSAQLRAAYGPIVSHIAERIPGKSFRLAVPPSSAAFEKRLSAHAFHFALPNPYQTVAALRHGYRVFGRAAAASEAQGVILVRRDGRIHDVCDLKGKRMSYPSPDAVAAAIMPQHFLHSRGLDVNRDIENAYVGSEESSILNVFHGLTAAGGASPAAWQTFQEQHPEMAAELLAKWTTGTLAGDALVARNDVPADIVAKVAAVLFSLQDSEEGRRLLGAIPLPRFEPATAETYASVQDYVQRYGPEVRQLGQ